MHLRCKPDKKDVRRGRLALLLNFYTKKKLRDAKHTEESHRRVGEVRPRCGMTKNQLCVKIKRLSAENQNASNAE